MDQRPRKFAESSGLKTDESPSKRMRSSFVFSNAAEVISNSDEKMELISWKGKAKTLEARISSLERALEEQYALSENERGQQELTKNKLESRISSLERQLIYVSEREKQAVDRASEAEKLLNAERDNAESRIRKLSQEKRLSEQQLFEQNDQLRVENQSLHEHYMDERRDAAQLRHDCSQLSQEVQMLKRRNAELNETVATYTEQLLILRGRNQELQDELKAFRDDSALANVMRGDLKNFNAMKQENVILKKQVERFNENPFLAKEKNLTLDEVENLKEELQEQMALVASLETQGRDQRENMEATISAKDDLLASLNSKCSELETGIAEKDAIINQLKLNATEIGAQWKVDQDENAELLKGGAVAEDSSGISCMSLEEIKLAILEKDARIDYLETRYGLKLDYDPSQTRIIHLEDNPLSDARKQYAKRMQAIEEENQKLRVRIHELERLRRRPAEPTDEIMDEDVTSKVDLRLNVDRMDATIRDLQEKVRKLEEEKQKIKERMTEVHQNLTREYREMVLLLTGYQLKMKEGGLYVVQSIYEKERENYFLVQKTDGGEINLLENEYSPRWMDFVDTYLMTDHSIPAFLAAVTLSLYEKDKDGSGAQESTAGAFASSSR